MNNQLTYSMENYMKRMKSYGVKQDPTGLRAQFNVPPIQWEALKIESNRKEIPFMLTEGNDFYELKIIVPGFRREDFYLVVKGRALQVKLASLHAEERQKGLHTVLNRPIILPEHLDPDFTSAEYRNGQLEIYFSKSTNPSPNKIEKIFVY